ncbi:hypothetical protein KY337_03525 [Candidatus Woesearchaeota archaeon]|nr:hypothetical protein [Candidatus Woesearchaeota archaeon]
MKLKFLFLAGPCGADEWMYRISKELEDRLGIQSYFLCLLKRNKDFLLTKGVSESNIFVMDIDHCSIKHPDSAYLMTAEKKYGFRVWDFWGITAPRKRSRYKILKSKVLTWFEYAARISESVFSNVNPDYFVLFGPAGFSTAVLYKIAEKNCKILELQSARIPGRFTVVDNLNNAWPLLKREYQDILNHGISDQERKNAENFISNYGTVKQDCIATYKDTVPKKLKRYVKYAKIIVKNKKLPDFTITIAPMVVWPVKQRLFMSMRLFESPVQGEKFIFFPLHFQPEAATLIYGKWYENQINLIENIAKAMPLGYKLYVKEHSFGFGNRTLKFYNEIKKLPNVRLISPYTNTVDLIKKSSLIVTITGTVGWEGCLFKKKVLTFGDVFYNLFDEVIKVKNIRDLPQLIEDNLDSEIKSDDLILFVAAVLKSSYRGIVLLPSDCNNASLAQENISNIVDGVVKYIGLDD